MHMPDQPTHDGVLLAQPCGHPAGASLLPPLENALGDASGDIAGAREPAHGPPSGLPVERTSDDTEGSNLVRHPPVDIYHDIMDAQPGAAQARNTSRDTAASALLCGSINPSSREGCSGRAP